MTKKSSSFGYSLLEFAAVLVALLPIVFGAIDINNALQAYTALQESTNTALRCLYPSDGACHNADYTPPEKLVNWYQTTSEDNLYVNKFDYRGSALWMNFPRYTFNQFQVFNLGSVSYELPRHNYYARNITTTLEHPLTVLMQTATLPKLKGDQNMPPVYNKTHPNFVWRLDQDEQYPSAHSISGTWTLTDSSEPIRIQIPALVPNLGAPLGTRCRESAKLDKNKSEFNPQYPNNPQTHHPVFTNSCDSSHFSSETGSSSDVRIMLWVQGRSTEGSGGTKVLLSIVKKVGDNFASHAPLGGQFFDDTAPVERNFVPRGVPSSAYVDSYTMGTYPSIPVEQCGSTNCLCAQGSSLCCQVDADDEGADENCVAEYGYSDISIPYNSNEFYVQVKRGEEWPSDRNYEVQQLKIFTPQYALASFSGNCTLSGCEQTCAPQFNGTTFGEGVLNISGNPSLESPAVFLENTPAQSVSQGPAFAIAGNPNAPGPQHIAPFFSDADAHAGFLAQFSGQAACGVEELPANTKTIAPSLLASNACPQGNYGVAVGASAGQMESVCPLSHDKITNNGATPINKSWTEVGPFTVSGTGPEWTYNYDYDSCGKPFSFTPPTALALYPHRNDPTGIAGANSMQYVPVGLAPGVDPRIAQAENPTWSCPQMKVAEQQFDGLAVTPTPAPGSLINPGIPQFVNAAPGSVLTGERYEFAQEDGCLIQRISNEIHELGTQNGTPDFAYVAPQFNFMHEDSVQDVGEVASIYSDSCIPYRTATVVVAENLVASNVPENSPPPSTCDQPGSTCHTEFASFVPGTGQAATLNIDTAKRLALGELTHAYPRAKLPGAGSANGDACPEGAPDMSNAPDNQPCITVVGNPDVEPLVTVRTQMNVPLNLLGGHSIPMSYTSRRTFEREFSK